MAKKLLKKGPAPQDSEVGIQKGSLLQVAPERSILTKDGDHLTPGDGVVVGDEPVEKRVGSKSYSFFPLSLDKAKRHLALGSLVEWLPPRKGRRMAYTVDSDVEAPASDVDADSGDLDGASDAAVAKEARALASEAKKSSDARKRKAANSLWNVPQSKVKGLSLIQLNAMIKDKDKSAPQFTLKEEAVAWLSQDAAED